MKKLIMAIIAALMLVTSVSAKQYVVSWETDDTYIKGSTGGDSYRAYKKTVNEILAKGYKIVSAEVFTINGTTFAWSIIYDDGK